jgi:hypothetical protein
MALTSHKRTFRNERIDINVLIDVSRYQFIAIQIYMKEHLKSI